MFLLDLVPSENNSSNSSHPRCCLPPVTSRTQVAFELCTFHCCLCDKQIGQRRENIHHGSKSSAVRMTQASTQTVPHILCTVTYLWYSVFTSVNRCYPEIGHVCTDSLRFHCSTSYISKASTSGFTLWLHIDCFAVSTHAICQVRRSDSSTFICRPQLDSQSELDVRASFLLIYFPEHINT